MQTDGSTLARRIGPRLAVKPWIRGLGWGVLSLISCIALLLLLVWPIGQLVDLFDAPHPEVLGLWAFAWVAASGPLALATARMTLGSWPRAHPLAWVVLLTGALVSAGHIVVLGDWSIARFGFVETDYLWPTSLLFAVVGGTAAAGFGVQVAPRWAVRAPLLAAGGGLVLGACIVSSNIPGLSDGLEPYSWPLAGWTAAAALYIGAVGVLSLARLRRG
ncbi:MAG: hypothetical protein ABIQ05_02705 [Candidatus Limnocylindria bacterium]